MNNDAERSDCAPAARLAELQERIEILSRLGDEELGSFTRLDWLICVLMGAVLPLLVLYFGAP